MKKSNLIIAIFITFLSNAQLSISTGYNVRVDHFKYGYSNFGMDLSYKIKKFSISLESTLLYKNNLKFEKNTDYFSGGGNFNPIYRTKYYSISKAKLNYNTFKLTLNFVKESKKCLFFKNAKGVYYIGIYAKIDQLLSFTQIDFMQHIITEKSYTYNPMNYPTEIIQDTITYNKISNIGVSKIIYSFGLQLERRVYPKNNLYFGYKISMGLSDKIRLYNLYSIPDYFEETSQTYIYTNPHNYQYFLFFDFGINLGYTFNSKNN